MKWIILCWAVLIKLMRMICMVVSRNSNSSGRYICEFLKKLLLDSKMNYVQVCVWLTRNNMRHSSSCQLKSATKRLLVVSFFWHATSRLIDVFIVQNGDAIFVQSHHPTLHFVPAKRSASTWNTMKCCSLVTVISHSGGVMSRRLILLQRTTVSFRLIIALLATAWGRFVWWDNQPFPAVLSLLISIFDS